LNLESFGLVYDVFLHSFYLAFFEGVAFCQERNDIGKLLKLLDGQKILIFGVVPIKEEEDEVDPPIMDFLLLGDHVLMLACVSLLYQLVILVEGGHARLQLSGDDVAPLFDVAFVPITWRIDN